MENEDVGDNDSVFMYLNIPEGKSLNVSEILEAIRNPEEAKARYQITTYKQRDIPRDVKWINLIFKPEEILNILNEKKCVRMGNWFEPSRGNYGYSVWALKHGKRPDIGAKDFLYFSEDKARRWALQKYMYPTITSSRYVVNFSFTEDDWKGIRDGGSDCYLFLCHKPRDELPGNVLRYIEWGETECRTLIRGTRGGGKICSQALACQERARHPEYFKEWYDLGGVVEAPILAVRQSQYKTRFIWNQMGAVTYDAMIAFIPKKGVSLTDLQLKALLAYFNSSFTQLYIESISRITGLGVAALEVRHAENMPILDVTKLDEASLQDLSQLFENLDCKAREMGGADKKENIERLWQTVIAEIDAKISEILGVSPIIGDAARTLSKIMMERRLARAGEPRRDAIKGREEETILEKPMKKRPKRKVKQDQAGCLNNYLR